MVTKIKSLIFNNLDFFPIFFFILVIRFKSLDYDKNQICNFKNIFQMHYIKNRINSKEDTCESKHVNTFKQKIHDVPVTPCFCCEILCFWKHLQIVTNNSTFL
jgi:hypothetical protein